MNSTIAAFLQAQGIRLRFTVDDPESFWPDPGGTNRPFTLWLDNHRHRIRTWLFEQLDPSTAPLAAALLLGWREEIDPEVNDAFARTGTTHLLAVSGLQLQALAVALLLIFRAIGLPRRPAYLIVGLTMIGYALLVGPAPSVVRSTVMTTTFCSAAIAQRLARPANTLSLAALLTLGINPMYLFDVGCQLSFLAIGALVWLVSPACTLVRHTLETIRAPALRSALGARRPRAPVRALVAHGIASGGNESCSTASWHRRSSGWRPCRWSRFGSISSHRSGSS